MIMATHVVTRVRHLLMLIANITRPHQEATDNTIFIPMVKIVMTFVTLLENEVLETSLVRCKLYVKVVPICSS